TLTATAPAAIAHHALTSELVAGGLGHKRDLNRAFEAPRAAGPIGSSASVKAPCSKPKVSAPSGTRCQKGTVASAGSAFARTRSRSGDDDNDVASGPGNGERIGTATTPAPWLSLTALALGSSPGARQRPWTPKTAPFWQIFATTTRLLN
ncbi:MAG: hypothetical protein AAFR04_15665, partial [Pseudomonadota bacterium]